MTVPERLDDTDTQEELVYCTVHPNIATSLRCNRCGRPMCTRCAVKTPVGYRCRECVREQQDKFFDAQMRDYLIAGVVALVMSFVAAAILARIGWFIIVFFLAPAAGGLIGRAVFGLTVVGTCVVLGALPFLLLTPLSIGIYLFMATGAAVAQFGLRLTT